jgi:hypothetical protein
MANALTIGIGADSSKLTADLARAQAQLTDFGKQLRDAAKSGDDEGVNRISKQYDDEFKNVAKLKAAVKDARNAGNEDGEKTGTGGWLATAQAAFGRMQTAMAPVKEGLSELHSRARDFGNALSNVAGNIFPNFKEALAIGTIGSGAALLAMVRSTAEWGFNLDQNARRLGISTTELKLLSKAAKEAGVDSDHFVEVLTKFNLNLQKAAETQTNAIIDLAKQVGGAAKLAGDGIADLTKRAGDSGAKIVQPISSAISDFRAQLEPAYNRLKDLGQAPAGSLEQWILQIQQSLAKGGDEALKVRQELSKLNINLPAQTMGEALDRIKPGNQDVFTKLGVSIFDSTGKVRGLTDAFGDFLDAFAKKDAAEQARIVMQTMGRGANDLIPLMAKGRAAVFEFLDAAKARGENVKGIDPQVESAKQLYIQLNRVAAAMGALKKSLILPFTDVFRGPGESMEAFLKNSQKDLAIWSRDVALTIKPIAIDLGNIFKGGEAQTDFGKSFVYWKGVAIDAIERVKAGFAGLMTVLDGIAASINGVFGTNLSGKGLLITLAVLKMTGAFAALTTGLKLARVALALVFTNQWTIAIAAIVAGALLIYANWDKIAALFWRIWDVIKQIGTEIGAGFLSAWNAAAANIKESWGNLTTWIGEKIDQILGFISKVVDAAKAAASSIASLLGASGGASSAAASVTPSSGGVSGASSTFGDVGAASLNASGGYISGPGSGTSDSIPARLSNGEYVVRAAAVSKLGVGFMNHLNSAGYALGGLVGRTLGFNPSIPSFAGGGLVGAGGGGTLNLTVGAGGPTFSGLKASKSTFDSLTSFARTEQRTSAGSKPSWYGS